MLPSKVSCNAWRSQKFRNVVIVIVRKKSKWAWIAKTTSALMSLTRLLKEVCRRLQIFARQSTEKKRNSESSPAEPAALQRYTVFKWSSHAQIYWGVNYGQIPKWPDDQIRYRKFGQQIFVILHVCLWQVGKQNGLNSPERKEKEPTARFFSQGFYTIEFAWRCTSAFFDRWLLFCISW